ncbi:MAG: molybdopterin molybdenumtransferase MoeA [Proteobacteria bacterium]|nr:MAG: molybdopterin molybdenumtransferase MoeA [Pseudomonadota bacterium]
MINVNEAWNLLLSHVIPLKEESVALEQSLGRVLTNDLKADRDYPPFDRVAMDGYALSYESWQSGQRKFIVQAMQTAGQKPTELGDEKHCIEIMTGSALPRLCDLVIRYEDSRRDGDHVYFLEDLQLERYTNVHRKGIDCPAGRSFPDRLMTPPLVALAASFGSHSLKVIRKPRISIIGTGDELVAINFKPLDYQIRASNIHAMRMAVESRGHEVLSSETIVDERDLIRTSVEKALESSDILLLSGGVSAGKTDYIPEILKACGIEEVFHKINQRPGKPLWFGQSKSGKTVFGLPGNPVSTLICLYRYVLPYIEAAQGRKHIQRPMVKLVSPRPKNSALTFFQAVKISYGDDAVIRADAALHNGSGDFASLSGTDGFVEIPGELEPNYNPKQTIFPFYSW